MSIVTLRMARPTPNEDWPREQSGDTILSVPANDLATVFLAALQYKPPNRHDALLITGDTTGEQIDVIERAGQQTELL